MRVRTGRHRRRGSLTLESLFVIMILLIATLAVFQFGFAMIIRQAAAHAATAAAREAAKGADADELVGIVEEVLRAHNIRIGPYASLVLEDPTAVNPLEQRGTLDCPQPDAPAVVNADEVRVTVCISMGQKPFINPLGTLGASLNGKSFRAASISQKE